VIQSTSDDREIVVATSRSRHITVPPKTCNTTITHFTWNVQNKNDTS
jgi:hypothetical protein